MPEVPLRFAGLPADLDGLRVLQISDVHIGYFVTPQAFEAMAERARAARPDLVLVTGDLSDYIDVYGEALRTAAAIAPPYGIYASIGNHEYYTGIGPVLREYERGPIPLLRDTGTTLRIGGAELYLAGADDPRLVSGYDPSFLPRTIDAAVAGAPSGAFVLLMSHRPEGFDHAARLGIPLTLAGHTHGGQFGCGGRSLMEGMFGRRYMWGLYRKGASTLYTTAGAGHWFPYRIGCPAEMPVYILRRA
jgi:predicted MPP superfamily phosphohydrolase